MDGGRCGFFASPLIATLAGVAQVVTVTQKSIIGVSVTDGQILWEYPWSGANGGTMPVLHDDNIIVSHGLVSLVSCHPER